MCIWNLLTWKILWYLILTIKIFLYREQQRLRDRLILFKSGRYCFPVHFQNSLNIPIRSAVTFGTRHNRAAGQERIDSTMSTRGGRNAVGDNWIAPSHTRVKITRQRTNYRDALRLAPSFLRPITAGRPSRCPKFGQPRHARTHACTRYRCTPSSITRTLDDR